MIRNVIDTKNNKIVELTFYKDALVDYPAQVSGLEALHYRHDLSSGYIESLILLMNDDTPEEYEKHKAKLEQVKIQLANNDELIKLLSKGE